MNVEWKFVPSDDPTVEDSETQLWYNGEDTKISIQHCLYGGGYAVNEVKIDPEWTSTDHGMFKLLPKAKVCALRVLAERVKANA